MGSGLEPTETSKRPMIDPEQWLDEYGDWLFQFAMARVHDSHTAEDLVQETLVAGFRGYDSFEHRSTVKTWLTTIMRRRVADYFRRTGKQKLVSDSVLSDDDHFAFSISHASLFHPKMSNEEFRSSIEREEFVEIVQRCLAKLPLHLRQAFSARVANDDMPLEELSEELQVTRNNLGVRLFRSRMLIRECLERFWSSK